MRDPYCYPDTEVLRNRLGIMDDKELRVAEADYVSLNLAELAKEEADRIFDFGELCRMHSGIYSTGQERYVSSTLKKWKPRWAIYQ